jgi:hypothetical protein
LRKAARGLSGCVWLQVRRHVEEVMKVVELDVLRDSLVGVPGQSGLSVEARKRLSIAVEQASSTCCTACNNFSFYLSKLQHC